MLAKISDLRTMNYIELYDEFIDDYSKYPKAKVAYWFAKKGGLKKFDEVLDCELTARDEFGNLLGKKHTLHFIVEARTESVKATFESITTLLNCLYPNRYNTLFESKI